MYKVTTYFVDLMDNDREYFAGDTYPRKGHKVDDKRLKELAGEGNIRGIALIKKVDNKEK